MSKETPTWARAIREAIDSALMDVHVAMPGKVQKYDVATQRVDVVLQLKRPIENLDTGEITYEELPVLPNIPVAFPRSSNFFCSFPIAKGDFVLVVFSEYSIDQWLEKGKVTAPGDIGHLTLTGGIALPIGPYPSSQALEGAHDSDMVMGEDGGTQVHIKPGGACEVTSSGSDTADDFVAMAEKVRDELDGIKADLDEVKSAFDTHVHVLTIAAQSGSGGTGTAAPPAAGIALTYSPTTPSSSNLKADE